MELTTVWFALIAVLWIGYFCLEGFDFGVGMLLPVLARDDTERRVMINTIGPVWDGNEVWLLVAGGATFAAFPEWYATLFSGFYLPLLLILLALIVRGVAFEYRAQARRRRPGAPRWDVALVVGSFVPALLWGVAFANIVRGVPIDAHKEYTGGFFTLLNPYALLGGLTTLLLFLTHGAMFLALKTDGQIRHRARALAVRVGLVAAVVAVVFLVWTQACHRHASARRSLFVVGRARPRRRAAGASRRPGGLGVRRHVRRDRARPSPGLFVALFPDVMPSSTDPAFSPDHHERGRDVVHADGHDLGGGDLHPGGAGSTRAGPTGCSAARISRAPHPGAAVRRAGPTRRRASMRPLDPRLRPHLRPRVRRAGRGARRRRAGQRAACSRRLFAVAHLVVVLVDGGHRSEVLAPACWCVAATCAPGPGVVRRRRVRGPGRQRRSPGDLRHRLVRAALDGGGDADRPGRASWPLLRDPGRRGGRART